ncbi:MAG TPA: aldehyde dehydrogenase family protein [Gaiellaceae bacterium]|jgi:aldehyde dehydrogenase (NAD+)/betaine-aldehyde dehydrogenase
MSDRIYDKIYVGGRWISPSGTGMIDVVDPTTEQVIGAAPEGTAEDVDRAVRAASAASDAWAILPVGERAAYMTSIADRLRARRDELVELIIHEVGSPRELAEAVQTDAAIQTFVATAEVVGEIAFEEIVGQSLVVREPIGVVGGITPWNYPLLQIAGKVAAAMIAGCTVVLKPSEVTPFNAFVLAEAVEESGLPAGVFNLVAGYGPVAGEAVAAHPLVDMVSFTGSTRAGRRVSELAAATVKRTTMELGGKSPNVLLDDLTGPALAQAVAAAVRGAFPNSGQNCGALTRLLAPRSHVTEVEELAADAAEQLKVGDPSDRATAIGPLVSQSQRDRVRRYIETGIREGARLLTGGTVPPAGLERGYFVMPTVFTDVTPGMTIAREEIFGPVLSILSYEDDDDAVRLANDTEYGLSAGVRGADPDRAQRIARRIRAGQVLVNDGRRSIYTPFGGFRLSGYGRECGRWGIEEFLTTRALHV